ncbi:sensor histidine kinase [Polaribacter sargassicola]|uniref:sensor histidine kinase n=1 Tax=Polaribacter sargassicola TaxID=2836891 RepID=UPI001F3BEF6B|nr:sensor histidine kinase [Polaribacter sp. DS7-9]MCG1037730.1 histidine kinase [Polaribacter sp. DS7-9]
MNFNSKQHYQISLKHHIIFWSIYFVITVIRWGGIHENYLYSLKTTLIGFPIEMILVYLNVYVFMPKFAFNNKRYTTYIVLILSSIFLMVLAKFYLNYYLLSSDAWKEGLNTANNITLTYILDNMIGELYVITFVTAIKITLDLLKEQKRVTSLEKAQLETELLFLRTQVSPHFFFNTLNNIYSLAVERSKKTQIIILKLSELMRYLLYETKSKRQTLENEILCIQNYLDLERVRHNDDLEVNMSISGNIEDKEIAPILLLSFIENAFKHGAYKNIGKVKIDIDFSIKNDFLFFTITNPMPANSEHEKPYNQSSGIGLKNVKKRLALGYHKNDYKLVIKNNKKRFFVKLRIRVANAK